MHTRSMRLAFLIAMLLPASAGTVRAADDDVAAGERLYIAQCKICHGSVTPDAALPSPQRFAMSGAQTSATDAPPIVDRVAFAPPFGPHLRGVFGRPAGSVEGFD